MIGIEHIFKVHADANGIVVFDSFVRREFSHDETRTDINTAVSIDDHGNQAFVVNISYPEGKEPELATQTVSALFHDALTAIEIAVSLGTARGTAPKAVPTKVEKAVAVVEETAKKVEAKVKNVVEAIKAEVKEVVTAVEEKGIVAEVKEAVAVVEEKIEKEVAEVKAKL